MNRFASALLLGAIMIVPALAQPAPPPAGAPAAGAPPGRGAGGRGGFQMPPPVKGPAGPFDPVAITPDKEIPMAQALEAAQAAVDACLALPRKSAAAGQNPPAPTRTRGAGSGFRARLRARG